MKISLIVPVFNEESAIPIFYEKVRNYELLNKYDVEIIFINDGSHDLTEQIIYKYELQDNFVKAINFTRNFGKEAALIAGIEYANGDVIIPIDVDLQDPIELIPVMVKKWEQGADIVLAKRVDRSSDTLLKRKTAEIFYKIHNKISSPKLEENVGDFRLISNAYIKHILKMKETNLFMKGILSWVGGNIEIVEYKRNERSAGETKFNWWKLWNLALDGITSFSTVPLRIWSYLGFFISFMSFIYGSWMIFQTIIWGNEVKGFPSLFVSILFLGGIQLIGIGILGEYIGRIYMEIKNRPRYLIKEKNVSE